MRTLIITVLAACLTSLLLGYILFPIYKKFGMRQHINKLGPGSHMEKQGTVTMGGVVFVVAAIVISAVFMLFNLDGGHFFFFCLIVTLLFTLIGFADDYTKFKLKRSDGLSPRQKLLPQIFFAVLLSVFAYLSPDIGSQLIIPFTRVKIDIGIFYIPLCAFMQVAMVNSANLLDGLDGLCAKCSLLDFAAFAVIALGLADGVLTADYTSAALFAAAFCGALIGFLRYNAHPGQWFMGDTGSFAIGGALAALAICTRLMLLLPFIALAMVVSSVSDILQLLYMRRHNGRKLLRMSPLHHHLELSGMPETRIITLYTISTALICLAAVTAYI